MTALTWASREGIPLGDCIKIARGSKTWPRLS